jgi:hypothetical protein
MRTASHFCSHGNEMSGDISARQHDSQAFEHSYGQRRHLDFLTISGIEPQDTSPTSLKTRHFP